MCAVQILGTYTKSLVVDTLNGFVQQVKVIEIQNVLPL